MLLAIAIAMGLEPVTAPPWGWVFFSLCGLVGLVLGPCALGMVECGVGRGVPFAVCLGFSWALSGLCLGDVDFCGNSGAVTLDRGGALSLDELRF